MDETDISVLIGRARAGDEAAWNALVERLAPTAWAVARGLGLSRSDAADACQVAWLRLVEHLADLREPARAEGWVAVVVRNEALRLLRTGARAIPTDDVGEDLPGDWGRPDVDGLPDELAGPVRTAFARIPAHCQVLIRLLMADDGLSYAEIAEAIGRPIGSIGPTRGRCLERLRTEMEAVGITSAGGDS